jgi:signal peptidase
LEIAPVPHRATRGEARRLALGLLVLVPVVVLLLVPTVLGLDRFVVTDRGMEGSLARGSVVLAQDVPPTDLHVGDVISFVPAGGDPDERVVRRVVSIGSGGARTQADTAQTTDPWTVPLTASTYSRVSFGVPWLGYPFVADGGWIWLALAAAAALGLALVAGRSAPETEVRPTRARLPWPERALPCLRPPQGGRSGSERCGTPLV